MNEIGANFDIEKSIKKARRKVYGKMIAIIYAIIIILFVGITVVRILVINDRAVSYARMQGNLTVFSSPSTYGGYGTNLSPYSPKISVYGSQYSEFSYVSTHWNIPVEITPFMLKMRYYNQVGTRFEYGKQRGEVSTESVITILQHNPNNVAFVSLTLDRNYGVEELQTIEEIYNVKITWLALETGNESTLPENITMDNENPVRMFGIPTTFTKLNTHETYKINYGDSDQYMTLMKEELQWTLDHKNYIAKNGKLLIFDDIKNVLNHGMKIYGIVAVGPTEELVKLCKDDKVISGMVDGVYPWDLINK